MVIQWPPPCLGSVVSSSSCGNFSPVSTCSSLCPPSSCLWLAFAPGFLSVPIRNVGKVASWGIESKQTHWLSVAFFSLQPNWPAGLLGILKPPDDAKTLWSELKSLKWILKSLGNFHSSFLTVLCSSSPSPRPQVWLQFSRQDQPWSYLCLRRRMLRWEGAAWSCHLQLWLLTEVSHFLFTAPSFPSCWLHHVKTLQDSNKFSVLQAVWLSYSGTRQQNEAEQQTHFYQQDL